MPASSALSATWLRLRAALWRRLAVVGSLCLGIAVLLTTMDGGGFGYKLLYSVFIGAACTSIVDTTRLAAAWWVDRMRKARGLAVQDSEATMGWRGAVPGTILALRGDASAFLVWFGACAIGGWLIAQLPARSRPQR